VNVEELTSTASRHPTHFLTTSFLMSTSILSGARLIWLVNKAGWSVTTTQVRLLVLPLFRNVIDSLISTLMMGKKLTR
jgi:hypothetical protein